MFSSGPSLVLTLSTKPLAILQASFEMLREMMTDVKGLGKKKNNRSYMKTSEVFPQVQCYFSHLYAFIYFSTYSFFSSGLLIEFIHFLSSLALKRQSHYVTAISCVCRPPKMVCPFFNQVIFSAFHSHRLLSQDNKTNTYKI